MLLKLYRFLMSIINFVKPCQFYETSFIVRRTVVECQRKRLGINTEV